MERICDPCLDRLLAGILSLCRATPGSREYRRFAPTGAKADVQAAAALRLGRATVPQPIAGSRTLEFFLLDQMHR
jgi:hypothetical protein